MKKTRYDIHIEMKIIINTCSNYFDMPTKQIFSKTREKHVIIPRQWIMYFLYNATCKNIFSLNDIVKYLYANYNYKCKHTTIIHSKNKIEDYIKTYKNDLGIFNYLDNEIKKEILKNKIHNNNNYICFKSDFNLKRIKSIEIQ